MPCCWPTWGPAAARRRRPRATSGAWPAFWPCISEGRLCRSTARLTPPCSPSLPTSSASCSFIFVLDGVVEVSAGGERATLHADGFAYLPAHLKASISSAAGAGLLVYERRYALPKVRMRAGGSEKGACKGAQAPLSPSLTHLRLSLHPRHSPRAPPSSCTAPRRSSRCCRCPARCLRCASCCRRRRSTTSTSVRVGGRMGGGVVWRRAVVGASACRLRLAH